MAETYVVNEQRQSKRLNASGRAEDGMEVTFTTNEHHLTGQVWIPLGQYTADAVNQVICARVAQLLAVQNL